MTEPLIRIHDVEYTYPAGKEGIPALRGVNLTVAEGEYLAIIGANGSGKSTLARHLNALLIPTRGDVWVNGWNTRDPARTRDIRRTVGMVFQVPDNQIVATVVEEDVAFGPENLGVPDEELPGLVTHALEAVGLAGQAQRASHLLSAGQKQRLAIAAALAMRPRCLVLDEGTAMLDPVGKAQLLEILRRLHQSGTTIITVTHTMSEAAEANRVVVLAEGKVAKEGPPAEVFSEANALRALGLDLPPVSRLAHLVAERLAGFPTGVLNLDEFADQASAALQEQSRQTEDLTDRTPPPEERTLSSPRSRGSQAPWIELEDVRFTYFRGTPLEATALRGVSLEVWPGETVALIGPTGSGKSTLLQHLNGLLRPQTGRVQVFDRELSDPRTDVRPIRQRVGLVFQQPELQLFERYAGDDVAFGPLNYGLSLDKARERVRNAMEIVGLPFEEFKDRLTLALSGGERRRLALAGVLALEPQVLALDEPTAGLDPRGRSDLLAQLRQWRERGERAIILTTHNMDDVALLADRVYVLVDGQIVRAGSTREVFGDSDFLLEHGLGLPTATQVVRALAKRRCAIPANLLTLEEVAEAIVRLAHARV